MGKRPGVRKESERHKTGCWGRGDGSFVTVRSVCFSFITARARSGPQPKPRSSPLLSQPPITISPSNLCQHLPSLEMRRLPCYNAHCTHTMLSACVDMLSELNQMRVPVTLATYSLQWNPLSNGMSKWYWHLFIYFQTIQVTRQIDSIIRSKKTPIVFKGWLSDLDSI